MIKRFIAGVVFIGVTAGAMAAASAAAKDDIQPGGRMVVETGGKRLQFPVLKTDITADIQGDAATVTVVQTFANPTTAALNATYLFPLNKDAAVYGMTMEVGDEIVTAKIQKSAEAKATFDKAQKDGKAAALLQQHRPNMFTQDVANLMPGLPVKVTLKYVQTVPRIDGAYELVTPLVVGPRYMPAGAPPLATVSDTPSEQPVGQWSFGAPPQYPDVTGLTVPAAIEEDRVSIRVNIASGVAIGAVSSPTHALTVEGGEHARSATLSKGRTIDNRDFVLRYQLGGEGAQAGVVTHRDQRGGYFSLLVEPPQNAPAADITSREVVFVLDTSGSMAGEPVEASKTFMRHALKALRPGDYFRVIQFSNGASEFTSAAVAATPENIRAGTAYVERLSASGGTEVLPALRQAFAVSQPRNTMRVIVFLSDGYVGNEAEILQYISERSSQARFNVFGIGTAVNHYLLAGMARQGRGYARFIDPTEKSHDAAIAFANRLKTPVLTDIVIDWGDLKPADVTPAILPDLFEGDSIRILGRFETTGSHIIKLTGLVNGRKASLPVKIETGGSTAAGEAIPLMWARSRIGDAMRDLTTPAHMREGKQDDSAIQAQVTKLGLEYSLATQWTSFVAVSEKVVNRDPAAAAQANVPLPMVDGVTALAYPEQPGQTPVVPAGRMINTQAAPPFTKVVTNFGGAATPEPGALAGLAIIVLLLSASFAGLRRRSR
jgi:Ca-activated chloride channel family protein